MDPILRIVSLVDFSSHSRAAITRAVELARATGAEIEMLHALAPPLAVGFAEYPVPESTWEGIRREAAAELAKLRGAVEAAGQPVRAEVRDGAPQAVVQKAVGDGGGCLVAMGTRGRGGLARWFLGSVAERVLRSVPCPVLAVAEDERSAAIPIRRVLLATDFSPSARCAGVQAVNLARKLGARLDTLHVFEVPADHLPYTIPIGPEIEEQLHRHAVERLAEELGAIGAQDLEPGTQVLRGQPSVRIAEEAQRLGAQLIVMGTRGNTGPRHLVLGSVAERTLRLAGCSVLAVKEPEGA